MINQNEKLKIQKAKTQDREWVEFAVSIAFPIPENMARDKEFLDKMCQTIKELLEKHIADPKLIKSPFLPPRKYRPGK